MATRMCFIAGRSGFVLVPIREGADFTLYRRYGTAFRRNPTPGLCLIKVALLIPNLSDVHGIPFAGSAKAVNPL